MSGAMLIQYYGKVGHNKQKKSVFDDMQTGQA